MLSCARFPNSRQPIRCSVATQPVQTRHWFCCEVPYERALSRCWALCLADSHTPETMHAVWPCGAVPHHSTIPDKHLLAGCDTHLLTLPSRRRACLSRVREPWQDLAGYELLCLVGLPIAAGDMWDAQQVTFS